MKTRVVAALVFLACGSRSDLTDYWAQDAATSADAAFDVPVIVPDAGADVLQTGPVAPPRPIAPLSTSSVTTQRPTFHWQLPAGVDGGRVEICSNRDCGTIEQTFDGSGDAATASTLTPGVHFYRLRGIAGSLVGVTTSPTFEFVVPHRSSPRDTSWGTFPDVDGDGYADVVVAGVDEGVNTITVFPGASSGVHHKVRVDVGLPTTEETIAVASAGDVDGDGYGDVVLSTRTSENEVMDGLVLVYRGGPGGIAANQKPAFTISELKSDIAHRFGAVTSAGDVNGDGYADLVVIDHKNAQNAVGRTAVYFGSPQGPSNTPVVMDGDPSFDAESCGEAGDVDGDGFPDIAALSVGATGPSNGKLYLFRGGPTGPSTASRVLVATLDLVCAGGVSPTPGDVNGDGMGDVIVVGVGSCESKSSLVVFHGGPSISQPMTLPLPTGYDGFVTTQFGGDIDGDGYDDVVAGLHAAATTENAGVAFFGSSTGLNHSSLVAYSLVSPGAYGWISGAGDLDRDGHGDVILAITASSSFLTIFEGGTKITFQTELGPLEGGWFNDSFR